MAIPEKVCNFAPRNIKKKENMCTVNMTFEVPDSRAIDIEAMKNQINGFFRLLMLNPSVLKKDTTHISSLRNAFVGDWNDGKDSTSYARMLREENILNDREVEIW